MESYERLEQETLQLLKNEAWSSQTKFVKHMDTLLYAVQQRDVRIRDLNDALRGILKQLPEEPNTTIGPYGKTKHEETYVRQLTPESIAQAQAVVR